jgi:hypothetical protein
MKSRSLRLSEVAIVVGSLLVLALLLLQLPRMPELLRQYRASRCLSNLHQIGAATRMYLDDYDGKFPFAGRDAPYADQVDVWTGLSPYVAATDVFLCPDDPTPAFNIRWSSLHGRGKIRQKDLVLPSSYRYLAAFYHPFDCRNGMNVAISPARSMSLSEVVFPARKALFNCYASEWARPAPPRAHHPEGWALCFVDGHVSLTSWKQLHRARRGAGIDMEYNLDWTVCGIAGQDLR